VHLTHRRAPHTQACTSQTKCSLNERFNLAKRLANAVSFVHTAGFVHKNIRPETIVLLADDESTLGLAVLVGFSMFRHVKGVSRLVGDDLVEKNICE
jgi:serine/threonine protein kinase